MQVQLIPLTYWKTEHDAETNEDAWFAAPERGLFAVADGVGTASFSNKWSRILVEQFVDLPLLSQDPFEVEWWVRQAQPRYWKEAPPLDDLPWWAKDKARDGSQSTLATLRISSVQPDRAKAVVLTVGDSCVIVDDAAGGPVSSFPVSDPADFAKHPLTLPSKAPTFNRDFHRAVQQPLTLHSGQTVILATDAVAKWILSQADTGQSFRVVASQTSETWPAFIDGCRERNEMVDDDATALILSFSADDTASADGPPPVMLGKTTALPREIIDQRVAEFEAAYKAGRLDKAAVAAGAGSTTGLDLDDPRLARSRSITTALNAVQTPLTLYQVNERPEFREQLLAQTRRAWETHRTMLEGEPLAAPLIQRVQEVVLRPEPPPPPRPDGIDGPPPPPPLPPDPAPTDPEVQRDHARNRFRSAFILKDDQAIVDAYDPILDDDNQLKPAERQRLRQAREALWPKYWREALASDDDERIKAAFDRGTDSQRVSLSPKEKRRVLAASKYVAAHTLFRSALDTDNDAEIVATYEKWADKLDDSSSLTQKERERYTLAKRRQSTLSRFQAAVFTDKDDEIVAAYDDEALDPPYPYVTSQDRERLALARQRLEALTALREVLATDNDTEIVATYEKFKAILEGENGVLADATRVTSQDRDRLKQALGRQALLNHMNEALEKDDDNAILQAYDAFEDDRTISSTENYLKSALGARYQRVHLARARRQFRDALQSGDDERMVTSYDPVLDNDPMFTEAERQQLQDARRWIDLRKQFIRAIQDDDDRLIIATADSIHEADLTTRFHADLNADHNTSERLKLARDRAPWRSRLDAATSQGKDDPDDDADLVRYSTRFLLTHDGCTPDPIEGQRIYLAHLRMGALWYIKSVRGRDGSRNPELEVSFRALLADFPPVRDELPLDEPLSPASRGFLEWLRSLLGM